MLVCKCGWQGTNLIPDYVDNTSHCPNCLTVFACIPVDDAVAERNKSHIVKRINNKWCIISKVKLECSDCGHKYTTYEEAKIWIEEERVHVPCYMAMKQNLGRIKLIK